MPGRADLHPMDVAQIKGRPACDTLDIRPQARQDMAFEAERVSGQRPGRTGQGPAIMAIHSHVGEFERCLDIGIERRLVSARQIGRTSHRGLSQAHLRFGESHEKAMSNGVPDAARPPFAGR